MDITSDGKPQDFYGWKGINRNDKKAHGNISCGSWFSDRFRAGVGPPRKCRIQYGKDGDRQGNRHGMVLGESALFPEVRRTDGGGRSKALGCGNQQSARHDQQWLEQVLS